MIVKIAILSHGLIHNTNVVLSRFDSAHLCTNINSRRRPVNTFFKIFLKSFVLNDKPAAAERSCSFSYRKITYIYPICTPALTKPYDVIQIPAEGTGPELWAARCSRTVTLYFTGPRSGIATPRSS